MMMQDTRDRGWTNDLIEIVTISLVIVSGGCGSATSDEATRAQARPAANSQQVQRSGLPDSLEGEATLTRKTIFEERVQPLAAAESENRSQLSNSFLPPSVVKDLNSLDARDRYRALDHWEAKDSKASLDPVFEALEDQDEAVRARAIDIVERHWAIEQEREIEQDREKG